MCLALRENGIDVLLASTDADLDDLGKLKNDRVFIHKGVPLILFPKQLGASYKYSRPFSRWLDQHVTDFDLVHIHAVFNHACIAAARACRDKGVAYIVRPLGTLGPWAMKQKSLRKKIFWHAGIKRMLTNAAAIHYTSKLEQRAVEQSLGLNHGVVVPLGIDLKVIDDAANGSSPVSKRPYVIVLSRLLPTKGIDVFLDAFLSIIKRKEFGSWRLVLAGEGPMEYVNSLKRTVAEQGHTDSVIFTGWLDGEEKEEALRNSSLLALPSYHENFGLCVIEALAYGVPVLISPHVNLAPEIESTVAGWIAEIDTASIEHALSAALGSRQERIKRGAAGRNLAASYAWPVVANRLTELYASVQAAQN